MRPRREARPGAAGTRYRPLTTWIPVSDLATALLDLQQLTERLRRECPWDREQTARTIVPHTVEEAYEVADAALAGSPERLLDELGDLLFQTFFLSLLLEEAGEGSLAEVARAIQAKLVRRHPHVFGEVEARTAGGVRERWDEIKRAEEGEGAGLFGRLPETLPALLRARKIQRRAAGVGFEYPDAAGALADLEDELRELNEAVAAAGTPSPETEPDDEVVAEVGDLLFAAVNVARLLNVDPELALRSASGRFAARVERAQELAREDGTDFDRLPLADQDRYYDEAKERMR
jgi:MazG family protein